jgi:hypothetical protein
MGKGSGSGGSSVANKERDVFVNVKQRAKWQRK